MGLVTVLAVGQCGQFTLGSKIRHDWKTFHTEKSRLQLARFIKDGFCQYNTNRWLHFMHKNPV